jgi:hypothetical protein
MSFREKVSPLMSPRNLVGKPRYSISPVVRVMGKAKSGKKSPAVTTFVFSFAQAGARELERIRRPVQNKTHRLISITPSRKFKYQYKA